MNDVLTLKGRCEQRRGSGGGGAPKLPKNAKVSSQKLQSLIDDLLAMQNFWKNKSLLPKMLISAYYRKVAAKSNRMKGFFSDHSQSPNKEVVGAKFSNDHKHIITYFVSDPVVDQTILNAQKTILILNDYFSGHLTAKIFNEKSSFKAVNFKKYSISKSIFQRYVADAFYVEKFDVEQATMPEQQSAIVTLYDTGESIKTLLSRIGIKVYNERVLDDGTALLDKDSIAVLMQKAPYLVAMATEDISKLAPSHSVGADYSAQTSIPSPSDQPTIGVIDTLFDKRVYFHDWVTYTQMIDPNITPDSTDYNHGTEVASIIVDGPTINPSLDDGCGRFKVKHFGVATGRQFSSFSIIRAIKEAVVSSPEIHVWNLSLGSNLEVNKNFISAEAAVLDQIQYENDVIFVIAGTNRNSDDPLRRIGAPADSINSLVVNSVDSEKQPASYSRQGIVLSFFTKPDLSYYGGDQRTPMRTVNAMGEHFVLGTSFSAPWLARKLSYMIDVLGLSREVAKALLIDAAIGWKKQPDHRLLALRGNGVVPVRIEDILHSDDDEIKFVIEGTSELYDTYTYNIPVPIVSGMQPFKAKATLCYFPKCSRNQGVDYTNTELDLYFGRIKDNGEIFSINENNQSDGTPSFLNEEDARKLFRKWDNVKHISETLKDNARPKKVYQNSMWALSLKTKERLNSRDGNHTKFGVVITLKEINGVNRIDDFIQLAGLRGWLVNRINVQTRLEIYSQAEQDVKLD